LEALRIEPRSYAVSTIHRAENTDDSERLAKIMAWLEEVGRESPIIMPLHPRTRKLMADLGKEPVGIRLIEPLGYLDMARLVRHAAKVFTDSGGLQKEAYFHRVPCVTLRDETEWVETIEAGWNRLWTTPDYKPRRDIEDYGQGNSALRVVDIIAGAI
jgi:UDP-GlcNAc3NAcA epimerase